jgi:DNA primase
MPDLYESVRNLPLEHVLSFLGFAQEWKPAKGGTELRGRCPICQPKKNQTAFNIAPDGKWHCFGCEAKGKGAIDLVMAVRKVGFRDAVELLQSNTGNVIAQEAKRPQLKQVMVPAAEVSGEPAPLENPPFKSTYEKFAVPCPWLKERGLSEDACNRYGVFQYDNPKRRSVYSGSVLLKIARWSDGECVGYLSRNIGDITPERPKYLLPKGLQKGLELFGAWQLKEKAPIRVLYVVESPFCVVKFHQLGFPAVSPFGWSLSDQQVAIIGQLARGVIFLPDRDKYTEIGESVRKLAEVVWVKTPELPDGVDDPEMLDRASIVALT